MRWLATGCVSGRCDSGGTSGGGSRPRARRGRTSWRCWSSGAARLSARTRRSRRCGHGDDHVTRSRRCRPTSFGCDARCRTVRSVRRTMAIGWIARQSSSTRIAWRRSWPAPAPTLRVRQGSEITVHVRNDGRHRGHRPLARAAAGQRLRRRAPRDPGADPGRRRVHLPAAVPRPRPLLVPPAHP